MSKNAGRKAGLTEEQIDSIVVTQADDDAAWTSPAEVRPGKTASLAIPARLAARAAFLARLHHRRSLEAWLTHIIEERVEVEEAAFSRAKQDLSRAGRT
jgi:hypothetical protein